MSTTTTNTPDTVCTGCRLCTTPAAPGTYQIATGRGTVHDFIPGTVYTVRGSEITNRPDSQFGKAVCGSVTSSAAHITNAPATCAKCIAARA
jgi:hypothetical protein